MAKRLLLVAALVPLVVAASAMVYFPAVLWHRFRPPEETALMEFRTRQAEEKGWAWNPRYEWVSLKEISPHLVRGVLAAEDTRFYAHWGFDLEQIGEAWEINRQRGEVVRGASTITQQTVKNLYLSPSQNVVRKVREALLTLWMELVVPKDRILELYLNVVELGPGIFGAQAAAEEYFGRSAARLSREQAALLAATLPAPLVRNPATPTRGLHRRQRMVLSRMNRFFGDRPRLAREDSAAESREPRQEPGRTETLSSVPITLPSAEDSAVGDPTPEPPFPDPVGGLPDEGVEPAIEEGDIPEMPARESAPRAAEPRGPQAGES